MSLPAISIKDRQKAIIEAIKAGSKLKSPPEVKKILDDNDALSISGEDLNEILKSISWSPLHWHAAIGDTRWFLDKKLNVPDEDGRYALEIAAMYGREDTVRSLLDKGAIVNVAYKNGVNALMRASYYGYINVVNALLEHNADVDAKNENGFTALMVAASNGNTEVVKILLKHKARVDIKDKNGWTALVWAAQEGHLEIVRELLICGANPYIKGGFSFTPKADQIIEAYKKESEELISRIKNGVSIKQEEIKYPNGCDKNGMTALMWAAKTGNIDAVNALLKHSNINPNLRDNDGMTAYLFAKDPAIISLLSDATSKEAQLPVQKKSFLRILIDYIKKALFSERRQDNRNKEMPMSSMAIKSSSTRHIESELRVHVMPTAAMPNSPAEPMILPLEGSRSSFKESEIKNKDDSHASPERLGMSDPFLKEQK